MFHQVEGLLVDKGITFADLKGVLTVFVHQMFGEGNKTPIPTQFFPFHRTERRGRYPVRHVRGKGVRGLFQYGMVGDLGVRNDGSCCL